MATTSSSRPVVSAEGENMGPPGKAMGRPRPDNSNRAVLGELTSNAKLDHKRTGSPLKRTSNVFDHDAKGFSYIKRRRLEHNAALTRRITPQSPQRQQQQQQQQHAPSLNEPDEQSEGDSGRESQNSNATRGSFSSLINYDPSSQQQQQQQQQQQSQSAASRPMSIKAAADKLRTRLRLAYYKVRTNQINVPFVRLRIYTNQRQPQPPPSPDALPMAPPPLRPPHERNSHAADPLPTPAPPLLSTPNMYSNRFMPFTAPSSSPPLVHDPLPRIAREAQARMAAAAAAADRDSLDSEATELADDHDDNGVAESPLDRRHIMLPTGT